MSFIYNERLNLSVSQKFPHQKGDKCQDNDWILMIDLY